MNKEDNYTAIGPETEEFLKALLGIEKHLRRLADHIDPPPADIVGTPYIAERLGCTTDWVAKMAANGEIPRRCVVKGSGDGKPWKFYRRLVDSWIEAR